MQDRRIYSFVVWHDPVQAAEWANLLVEKVNNLLQKRLLKMLKKSLLLRATNRKNKYSRLTNHDWSSDAK